MLDAGSPAEGPSGLSPGQEPSDQQIAQATTAGAQGDAIGSVNGTTGDVLIVHKDGTSEPAAAGTPVYADDIVATGADGAVEVVFKDGTTFSLGNSGQMRLDNLIYDPAGTNNGLDATLVKGAFVFVTGNLGSAQGEGVSIDTPAGTIGIRGTSGGVAQDPQSGAWIFTLFRDPDGKLSHFIVTNPAGQQLLDQEFESTEVAGRQIAPSQTIVLSPAQASALFSDALHMLPQQFPQLQRSELENVNPAEGTDQAAVEQAEALPTQVSLSELYGLDLASADLLNKLTLDGTDLLYLRIGDSLVPFFRPISPNTPLIDSDLINPNETRTTVVAGQYVGLTVQPNTSLLSGDISFSLPVDADGRFVIDPRSGEVTVASGPIAAGTYLIVAHAIDESGHAVDTAFAIEVLPNARPIADDDAYTVAEDSTLTVSAAVGVLANDRDSDGDTITATVASEPSHGTLQLNADGSFAYTPISNYGGPDSFTYAVSDGAGGTRLGTVNITVDAVNDAPVAVADGPFTTAENTPVSIPLSALLANDGDVDGDTLNITAVNAVSGGMVAIVGDNVQFTPAAHFDGLATFEYTISDGHSGTETAAVSVNVIDAVPDAVDDPITVADTTHKTIDLVIILDRSGSMNDPSGVPGVSTRLELARAAIAALFEAYQSVADLHIQIVDFADSAAASGWLAAPEAANAYLAGLIAGGGTNYTAAVDTAMTAYAGAPAADKTEVYFLSDGVPTAGQGLSAAKTTQWEGFLSGNHVDKAFAIGIGTGIDAGDPDLAAVAYPAGDAHNPVVVTQPAQLISTLVGTVDNPVSGNVIANDNFGIDGAGNGGGGLLSIKIDGVTYRFDGTKIVNDANAIVIAGATLVEPTLLGGLLEFHFDSGDYTYTPPDVTAANSENFAYTIVDSDGDQATATLHIDITNSGVSVADPSAIFGKDTSGGTNDSLVGTTGDDIMSGGAGNDTISGSPGNNHIQGGAGSDSLLGGAGIDVLIGGAGNDSLDGGAGGNVLVGGDGDDRITVGTGDRADGGVGNDLFFLVDNTGFTSVQGGGTVDLSLASNSGDVLAFNGTLDITKFAADKILGIETISMTDSVGGAGADKLVISAADVIDIGTGHLDPVGAFGAFGELTDAPAIRVNGEDGDSVNLIGSGWQQVTTNPTGMPSGYALYVHDSPADGSAADAYLLVQTALEVATG
jgi:VCBS repeat-containing protein